MFKNIIKKSSLSVLCFLVACGGGGGGGDGTGTPNNDGSNSGRGLDASASLVTLNSVATKGIGASNSQARTAFTSTSSASFACDQFGSGSVTTTIFIPDDALPQNEAEANTTPIPFDITAVTDLQNCDGLTGGFQFAISGVILGEMFDFTASFNGAVTSQEEGLGNCLTTFENLAISGATNGNADLGNPVVTGGLSIVCDSGDSLSCSFDGINIEDENAVNGACG